MNICKDKIKKYRMPIILVASVIVFMFAFWYIRLSDIRIDQEQVIESGADGSFTAKYSDIDSMAVSIDGNGENQESIPESIVVSISNSNGKSIGSYDFKGDALTQNVFGEHISLRDKNLKFDKGEKYQVSICSGKEQIDNVSVMLCGDSISIGSIYLYICIMLLFAVVVSIGLFNYSQNHFYLFFVLIMMMLGILNNIIIKPLNVPDEPTHFAQSYELSNRMMGKESSDVSTIVYSSGIARSAGDILLQDAYFFFNDFSYGNRSVSMTMPPFIRTTAVPVIVYFPGALGITFARLFQLPYQFELLMGRITSILFLSLMAVAAMKLYSPFRYAIAAICFLPSVVWVGASYSYDVWNLSFIFVFVSLCFRIREQECGVRIRDVFELLILLVLFAPIKYVYVIIGLTVLFIPKKQLKNKGAVITLFASFIFAVVVMVMARGKEVFSYLFSNSMDTRGVDTSKSYVPYTLRWTAHHPLQTVLVYVHTFLDNTVTFISKGTTGEFYSGYVPSFLAILVLAIFVISMLIAVKEDNFTKKDRTKAVWIFILGCFTIYTAFLFLYSTVSDNGIGIIGGMQGRYFIPYLIFVPLFMYSDRMARQLNMIKDGCSESIRKYDVKMILLEVMVILNVFVLYAKFVGIALDSRIIH
jgi:uncharacterized membrane protein